MMINFIILVKLFCVVGLSLSAHLVSSLRLFPWFALLTPASSHLSPSPSLATHLQPPPGSFSVKAHFLFKLLLTLSCLLWRFFTSWTPSQAAVLWGRLSWFSCCSAMIPGGVWWCAGCHCVLLLLLARISWPQRPVSPLSSVAQWPAQSEMPNIENPSWQMAKLKHTFSLDKFFDLKMLRKVAQRTPGTSVPLAISLLRCSQCFLLNAGRFLF